LALRPGIPVILIAVAALLAGGIPAAHAATIHVKVLVDEEEPAVDRVWQERLRRRVDQASAVLRRYCGLEFSVTCFDRWNSDNRIQDFSKSLREFEHEVAAAPAQIAIGFSSQYKFERGRNSLGGTRGPLHSHIFIREGSRAIFEPERLEVVVHELGHFLGAAHSVRSNSVMRPLLGDGQSRRRNFQIQFDPDNEAIIRLVAREIQDYRIRRFSQLSESTRRRLRAHYMNLALEDGRDPVARMYVRYLDRTLRPGTRLQDLNQMPLLLTFPSRARDQVGEPNGSAPPR
jgi:hypothetical protein